MGGEDVVRVSALSGLICEIVYSVGQGISKSSFCGKYGEVKYLRTVLIHTNVQSSLTLNQSDLR